MPLDFSTFKLIPTDGLIDMAKHSELLMKWFDNKLVELKMIYRGTDHEFTTQSFDELCNNKGPTLTVIQSDKNDSIFGGYISRSRSR